MTQIQVGVVHYFADEFLNSIRALMYHAKTNEYDSHDYIYTMPSIIQAMAFLESVFELFLYNLQNNNRYNIDNADKVKIIKKYTNKLKQLRGRYTIEQKYNDVLSVMDISNINNTDNITAIRDVRNYIIHDKVELLASWVDKTQDKVVELLKDKFVPKCKNISSNSYFWFHYINYNGTTWILNEIFNFYIIFCTQLKIESIFKSKIEEIQLLYPSTVQICQEELSAK